MEWFPAILSNTCQKEGAKEAECLSAQNMGSWQLGKRTKSKTKTPKEKRGKVGEGMCWLINSTNINWELDVCLGTRWGARLVTEDIILSKGDTASSLLACQGYWGLDVECK